MPSYHDAMNAWSFFQKAFCSVAFFSRGYFFSTPCQRSDQLLRVLSTYHRTLSETASRRRFTSDSGIFAKSASS